MSYEDVVVPKMLKSIQTKDFQINTQVGVSTMAQWVKNLTAVAQVAVEGWVPGPAQCVKKFSIASTEA